MTDALADQSARSVKVKDLTGAGQVRQKSASQVQIEYYTKLLDFESEVRSIQDERELSFHLCNSSRRVIPFKQCFYGKVSKLGDFTLQSSSSVSIVDRNVPFNRWIEKIVQRLLKEAGHEQSVFSLPKYCNETDEERESYPFSEFLWTPQIQDGQLISGTLMTREAPWIEADCAVANRVSGLYLHAQAAIQGRKTLTRTGLSLVPFAAGLCVLAMILGFVPVPITALAPVEVVPKDPYVLAAPFDGVVKEIRATQGKSVEPGESLVIFDDVHLLNNKKLADQSEAIADARYQRAMQSAIADHRAKREIEVARAEFELARAEKQYASELLEQARLTAPVPGIAIFSDKSDWEGKPVSAGEAIVSVADPAKIELKIDLPIKESIVLNEGARIKIFLDSDPLNPLEATLVEASYRAQPDKRDILAYSLTAELAPSESDAADADSELPRIGVQGTAQVFSGKASLAYVIFRRPITAIRQYTGW